MTVFHCEGFETLGNKATAAATLESRIAAMPRMTFQEISGGHTDVISIIDDFEPEGFALDFPKGQNGRSTFIVFEWPSTYKVSTNSSHPVMCVGFRLFAADTTPDVLTTVWSWMVSASSAQSFLRVAANGNDLVWDDNTGTATISGVLTHDTWHYIEIEFKATTSGNGGYVKIYVDGTLQYDPGARSIASATFFSSYGTRIGVGTSNANETGDASFAFDDLYQMEIDGVVHTEPLGPCRVKLLSPSSDSTPNDWTPSVGTDNYATVDGQDWDTSDYVEADTNGDDDHYGMGTLSGTANVHALQIDVICEAVDGTPNLHVGFDNGVADEADVGTVPTGSTSAYRQIFTTRPDGAAWDEAGVNGCDLTQRMTE